MDKTWNVISAQAAMSRARLPLSTDIAAAGIGVDPAGHDAASPVRAPASRPIERLVLVGSSEEGRAAIERRAALLSRDVHPTPRRVELTPNHDLASLTRASDLVLVDRRKPLPIVVPYLARAVRRLLRRSHAPVLVVGGMPRASYRHVVIAADLKTDVGEALAAVNALAPGAAVTLLHAYHAPFDGKLQWAGVPETDIAKHRADARREAALGMAALVDRHALRPARTLLRYGWPVPNVLRTAEALRADLIVVVRKTQSWWADALGASVSLELAQRAHHDVLIVPDAERPRR